MSFWGVVVAAGEGLRFGRAKAAVELGGRPLWQWARDCLLTAGADRVIVVGPVPGGIPGGATRSESVAKGLAEVPTGVGFVLVHDAARPLASSLLASSVVERLQVGDVAAVVPAIAVRDTLKRVSDEGLVEGTVDRAGIMSVQTPQGFDTTVLRRAHATADGAVTDDAQMVEALGHEVAVVPGEAANLKITYAADLAIAEALR